MKSADAAGPTCPRHPDTVAFVTCQRCERPVCPECQRPAAVGILCVDCVNEHQKTARTPVSSLGLKVQRGRPLVAIGLIAVNVLVFLGGPILFGGDSHLVGTVAHLMPEMMGRFGISPYTAELEPWRWVTSGFVHAGLVHIGFNMFVLYRVASFVEPMLGRARFALLYFGSLLGGSAAVVLLGSETQIHVGASGAVFGVIAAYLLVARRLKLDVRFMAIQAGILLALGFVVSGISWQGHLGGAVAGAAITLVILQVAARAADRRRLQQ